jgi:hypothetical protein
MPHLPRLTRADALAVGLITLAAAVFFAPVWLMGGWLPDGGGDLVSFLWPSYAFAARTLHAGGLPLWNPHQYGGAPFWADQQSGVSYPITLMALLLTDMSYPVMEGLVMFHLWLAGLAMYACLRLLAPSDHPDHILPIPAFAGAAIWMFSDVFITHIGNLNLIAVAAWLPLVFLGAWRGLRDRSPRLALLAGVAFGIGTLAGHAQMTYFTVLLIGAVGLWWLIRRVASHESRVASQVFLLALIGLTGLALSAANWLPALEMASLTPRVELSTAEAARFSLPPRALIGLIAPWVIGRGPSHFVGDWDRVEVGYIGVVGLGLSLLGAWQGIRQRRGLAIFLTGLGGLAFLMALGQNFPLHALAYPIVPGLKNFRAPARFILLMNFAQSILAAEALSHPVFRRLSFRLGTGNWELGTALLSSLVAVELIAAGMFAEVQSADPRTAYQHPDAVAWLADQPGLFRIEGAAANWQPDSAALQGGNLYDIFGIANPLTLADYHTYYWGVDHRGSAAYDFLGVRYVITDGGPPGDATFTAAQTFASGVTIYENTRALPLALTVYRAESVATAADSWKALHDPAWNPADVVYVVGGPSLAGSDAAPSPVSIVEYTASRRVYGVDTRAPAYLVLSEVDYPGWVAMVDGVSVPIIRANFAFSAIYLKTPGAHHITLEFQPPLDYAGLIITLLSIFTIGALVVRWSVRDRRN